MGNSTVNCVDAELEKFEEWAASEGIKVWAFSGSKDIMTVTASACWSAWITCAESKDKDIQMFKKVICDLAETHGNTRWNV